MTCNLDLDQGEVPRMLFSRVRQIQETFLAKKKELWMAFVDSEKAFDRVPREVLWWALRCSGVEEWIVNIIKVMYEGSTAEIKLKDGESKEFEVKVGEIGRASCR